MVLASVRLWCVGVALTVAVLLVGCGSDNNNDNVPAPSGTIAYITDTVDATDVSIINANGTGAYVMPTAAQRNFSLSLRPDGQRIAVQSEIEQRPDIMVADLDGSNAEFITDSFAGNDGAQPAYRFDGQQLAFVSTRDGNPEIYVMAPDGSNVRRVTNNPASDTQPAYHPDGNLLVFQSDRDGNDEIYRINVDGTGLTRLTNNPASDQHPQYSPDGQQIVFDSDRNGTRQIYIMDANGSNVRRLTTLHGAANPTFSPDGAYIAFDAGGDIYTMRRDGTHVTRLVAGNEFTSNSQPSWSRSAS